MKPTSQMLDVALLQFEPMLLAMNNGIGAPEKVLVAAQALVTEMKSWRDALKAEEEAAKK